MILNIVPTGRSFPPYSMPCLVSIYVLTTKCPNIIETGLLTLNGESGLVNKYSSSAIHEHDLIKPLEICQKMKSMGK